MFPEHPQPFGPHPWSDPLAPQDYLAPRPPDWAFQQAGPVPPPHPEDFPYTEQGRREYYAAVEQAAHTSMAMQHHQHMSTQERMSAQAAQLRSELEHAFLLLL